MSKKPTTEELYDQYAETYSTGDFIPTTFDTARTAMSFADEITWHYILQYVPPNKNANILDAGAGDGYWSQKFIELGYHNLVLSDFSQGMLNQAKKRIKALTLPHNSEFVKSDIVDMKEFPIFTFDYIFSQYDPVSLCMNPRKAIKELARIAKRGAYIIVVVDTKFRRVSELIEAKQIDKAQELLNTSISYDFQHPQYNLTWEELEMYFEQANLDVIDIVGAPVFMHQVKEDVLNELVQNPETKQKLLDMELEYCTNRSLINFAGHLLIVGRKK